MTQNETKFMDSALALAETLNYTKAAKRLRISQPQLTKNIQELEDTLGFRLFDRDRKTVELNDAGRAYIEQAKLSIMYAERALQDARAAMRDADIVLHAGRSPYTDPFLVSTLQSIQLPLYTAFPPSGGKTICVEGTSDAVRPHCFTYTTSPAYCG